MKRVGFRDGMLGKKRSFSGAKAMLFNDSDRPKENPLRLNRLIQRLPSCLQCPDDLWAFFNFLSSHRYLEHPQRGSRLGLS